MALGGGTFISQNKILPGSYINFVSLKNASSSLSDRGTAALALWLDWGRQGEIIEVSSQDFEKNSLKIFGYPFTHPKMKGLRDLFRNIRTLYTYRLNTGGSFAENEFCTAKFRGSRGNDIKIIVEKNSDNNALSDVVILFDGLRVYSETVENIEQLSDNDYVNWKRESLLFDTPGMPLEDGDDGIYDVTNAAEHISFLDKLEAYSFNALGCPYDNASVNQLYASFAKRMRDEVGVKFQAVCFNTAGDHEGVVNVACEAKEEEDSEFDKAALVYWITGIIAGCAVNRSNLNKRYDGEFKPVTDFNQKALIDAIKAGKFMLHNVNGEARVLADINSLVSLTAEKGDDFKENQTVRVIDQIANDIAVMFNTRYLGIIPNNDSGRVSLWSDIVSHHQTLESLGAITEFSPENVTVEKGETKKSVVVTDMIMPVNAMAQLYMTCIIE